MNNNIFRYFGKLTLNQLMSILKKMRAKNDYRHLVIVMSEEQFKSIACEAESCVAYKYSRDDAYICGLPIEVRVDVSNVVYIMSELTYEGLVKLLLKGLHTFDEAVYALSAGPRGYLKSLLLETPSASSGGTSLIEVFEQSCQINTVSLDTLASEMQREQAYPRYKTDELFDKVKQWGLDRNMQDLEPIAQLAKLQEEAGELARGITRNEQGLVIDSVGDIIVVLQMLCLQMDLDINSCLHAAYDEIKDRRGKVVDGVYIKESDLK